jgi:hypothetical protein
VPRWKLSASLVLTASLFAPSPAKAFDPLATLAAINGAQRTLRQIQGRWRWLRGRVGKNLPAKPEVGPIMEKMRSPFTEERHDGVSEMLEVAERYEGRPKAIPQSARVEILLGQLLRDENWKTRYKAYQALTTAGFMEPVEDTSERFAVLFPKATPTRRSLGPEEPAGAAAMGKSDVDLLHDFLAALQTQRPAVRTKLAAVLEGLAEAGLVGGGAAVEVPAGPGLAPDSMPGAPDLPGAGVQEQGLF